MIPLYDHESEKWLIGALLTDAEVQKQLPTLPADLMHDPLNEKILSCMRRLQERREPIEPLSVQGTLRDAGEPDMAEYLIGCMRFAVSGRARGTTSPGSGAFSGPGAPMPWPATFAGG